MIDATKANEEIVHPAHYNQGIECWDYTTSHAMDFLQGSVIKYVTRFRFKNGIRDLEKALQFLTKLLEVEKAKVRTEIANQIRDSINRGPLIAEIKFEDLHLQK